MSENGYALTKRMEGCRLIPYKDVAGHWTVGYGHKMVIGVEDTMLALTQSQADFYLRHDMDYAESCIRTHVTVPLTQNQFDALCDFVFNEGCGAFYRSTLLAALNLGNYREIPEELSRWVYAGGKVVQDLVNRREAEIELWNS